MASTTLDLEQFTLENNNYGYSATPVMDLGATEYTLVSIVVDASGSVSSFEHAMMKAVQEVVKSCKHSPRADNLMIRLLTFNSNLNEVHGFKMLQHCNTGDYNSFLVPNGMTALYDAAENAVSATLQYAEKLHESDYTTNAIIVFVTDGANTITSGLTANFVKKAIDKSIASEKLESLVTILVGVNTSTSSYVSQYLSDFQSEVGITQYVDIAQVNDAELAKLANFVSKSISAQSNSLGTGGPSQSLTF